MSSVSSLGSQPASLGVDVLRPADAGDVAGRAWAQGWGDGTSANTLRADVEPNAKGLSAEQHAERVLSHLVEGR
jgi:hypothetical protein